MTIKGAPLLDDKVQRIIGLLGNNTGRVCQNYWELIPDGNWSVEQQLFFIISSAPMAGDWPDRLIAAQLVIGPATGINPRSYWGAKPNILRKLKEADPELCKELAAHMREHKHVSGRVLANDDWLCLLCIMQMIDDCKDFPDSDVPGSVFAAVAMDWLEDSKRYFSEH